MSDATNRVHAHIAEEASMWLERIERTISEAEAQALRSWLKSARHREMIVDRCKRWHGPEILAVLGELVPVETLRDRVEKHYGRMVLAIFLAISGIGLMTVLIAVSKVMPGWDPMGNPLRAEAVVETGVGDRKTLALPDGGSILLNTATRVLINYTPHSRDITVLRGEVAFDARYAAERPFLVQAGARVFEVEPGDARFTLRRITQDQVELTVAQGRVQARESRRPPEISPALLRARVAYGSHTFSASQAGTLSAGWQSAWPLSATELERRTAWQSGRMIFEREPLEDALQEVQRYTSMRFILAEPGLGLTRVTATWPVGDVEAVMRHLRRDLHIESRHTTGTEIVLHRMEQSDAREEPRASMDCLSNYSCRRLDKAPHVRFVHGLTQTQ